MDHTQILPDSSPVTCPYATTGQVLATEGTHWESNFPSIDHTQILPDSSPVTCPDATTFQVFAIGDTHWQTAWDRQQTLCKAPAVKCIHSPRLPGMNSMKILRSKYGLHRVMEPAATQCDAVKGTATNTKSSRHNYHDISAVKSSLLRGPNVEGDGQKALCNITSDVSLDESLFCSR